MAGILRYRTRNRLITALLSLVASLLCSGQASHSAEYLTLTYGSFARTLTIEHLVQLCETGTLPEAAHELGATLELLSVETADMCDPLTDAIAVDLVEFDQALHSRIGEDLLFMLGQVIHTRPRVAPIASLRGALLTASIDGSISGLELLQRYPPLEMVIDLDRLFSEDWIQEDLADISRDFSWDVLN